MLDLRKLNTVQQDVSTRGDVNLQGISVRSGMLALDALQGASCHLDAVIDVLGDMAVESNEKTSMLYAVIASASIAKALVDSVVVAVYRGDATQSGEVH